LIRDQGGEVPQNKGSNIPKKAPHEKFYWFERLYDEY
jgi:hypothetical protein